MSDKSYDPQCYVVADEDITDQTTKLIETKEQKTGFAGVGSAFLDEILKPKRDTEVDDLLQIVNISEYAYQGYA